jgi:hypothetical protein
MRSKIGLTIAALAFVGLTAAVFAQQPQGQPGGRGRGGPPGGGGGFFGGFGGGGVGQSRMSLLRIMEVRKELELADEQIAEIEKIDTELREKYPFGGGRGGPPGGGGPGGGQDGGRRGRPPGQGQGTMTAPSNWYFVAAQQPEQPQGQARGRGGFGGGNFQPPSAEDMARMEQQRVERDREAKAKLADVLLPHQIKRLNEIFVQVSGVGALQDEDVAKELGISDAQKAKLAEVRTANGTAMREQMQAMFQGGGGGGGNDADREAIRTKMEGIRKDADAKLLAVLSADQQAKFEAMKGKAFAMPENAGRGGRGGPGGGRGTPGGGRPQNN